MTEFSASKFLLRVNKAQTMRGTINFPGRLNTVRLSEQN